MPPRYTYWTIIVDDLPTAFRAEPPQSPTFERLRKNRPPCSGGSPAGAVGVAGGGGVPVPRTTRHLWRPGGRLVRARGSSPGERRAARRGRIGRPPAQEAAGPRAASRGIAVGSRPPRHRPRDDRGARPQVTARRPGPARGDRPRDVRRSPAPRRPTPATRPPADRPRDIAAPASCADPRRPPAALRWPRRPRRPAATDPSDRPPRFDRPRDRRPASQ
jgi:hypothetical protein